MNPLSNSLQKGILMTKLPATFRYQLMFIISQTLYHSLDYFFTSTSTYNYQLFIFKFLAGISLNIAVATLVLISLTLSLLIILETFYRKKVSYLSGILQKIILPLQIYLLILIFSPSESQKQQGSTTVSTLLQTLFVLSLTISIGLINTLNIKLYLRHKNSREQGFHPICKFQFALDQLKLITGAFFAFLLSQNTSMYLLAIIIINLLSNLGFALKIHYENSKYEYLALVSQFYRWIPVILGFLTFSSVQTVTIQWMSFGCFLAFFCLCLLKPRILMVLLEAKYRAFIHKFNEIMARNSLSNKKMHENTQITLSYLSVSLSIFLNDKNGLKWSNSFKTQITNILELYSNQAHQALRSHENENHSNYNKLQKTQLKLPQIHHSSQHDSTTEKSTLIPERQLNQNNYSFNSKNPLVYRKFCQFLHSLISIQSELPCYLQFLCFNLPDTTNQMKQQLFYFHFLNVSKNRGYFDQINTQITHLRLIDTIGEQKQINNFKIKPSGLTSNLGNDMINFEENDSFLNLNSWNDNKLRHVSYEGEYCFEMEKPYFTKTFNTFTTEHEIFSTILSKLSEFVANQTFYLKITEPKNQEKSEINKYLKKRNSLRHKIQELIERYFLITDQNSKMYKSGILNYIKENWLDRNPISALDNFKKSLEDKIIFNNIKKKYSHNICDRPQEDSNSLKLVCMISAVSNPEHIFVSSSQFDNLLEIEEEVVFQTDSDPQTDRQNPKFTKINYNSLMIPNFREQHQKVSTSFYEKPISHVEKRYFLISKRWTNLLETKFKMYFHMMYEEDLLIVLDIDAEKVSDLIIEDKQNKQILFEHIEKKDQFKKERRNSVLHNFELKGTVMNHLRRISGISNVGDVKNSIKQLQTQNLTFFGREYTISSKKQPLHSRKKLSYNFNCDAQREDSNFFELKSIIHESEKQTFENEKRLKQFKFQKYKEKFTQQKNGFTFTSLYLFCLIAATIISFAVLITQQTSYLSEMMKALSDKIQLEQDYAKQNIYRSIDIGMLANMYAGNIDQTNLKPDDFKSLFDHIFVSIKTSIDILKLRHQFNPFTTRKSIRIDRYWQPGWINGSDTSFEMSAFKTEISFLEFARSFLIIVQLPYTTISYDPTTPHDLMFLPNLPIHNFSLIEKLWSFRYLVSMMNDHNEFTHPENGIFSKFKQSENQIFDDTTNENQLIVNILIALCVILTTGRVYLTFRSVKSLSNKYQISVETSERFRKEFRKSMEQLKRCIENMKTFNHETPMKIIKPKQFNYQQIIEKKSYTTIVTNLTTKDAKIQNQKHQIKQSRTGVILLDKRLRSQNFEFLFSFLKFPLMTFIVTMLFFLSNWTGFSNKVASLKTYSVGLEKFSLMNLEILNLMSQNLYLFSLNTLQLKPNGENEDTTQEYSEIFAKTITRISTTDKTNIIEKFFANQQGEQQTISKILYQNLCEQFPVEMNCPLYMAPKINGLIQKYGQTIKNIKLLFHKITTSKRKESGNFCLNEGALDTSEYQERYLETYENINELVYINKKLGKMFFSNLQEFVGVKVPQSLALRKEQPNQFSSEYYVLFCFTFYLLIESILSVTKLYKQTKIVVEEFLRVGTCKMFENQKNSFEGYDKFINIAQKYECLKKD